MALLRQFLTASFVVLSALSLSACSQTFTPQPTSFVGPNVPKALRTCAGKPAPLTGEFTQRDVAVYIVKLRDAHSDCYGNLAAVDQILSNVERELLARATTE
jgi:hypothetical protein